MAYYIWNSFLLAPPLTLRAALERYKNLRHVFEEFLLTCSRFSSNSGKKRPHTSSRTTAEILGFTVLDHPPYGPDLASYDFHFFPKLKEISERTSLLVR
jgi:hypothetical protein